MADLLADNPLLLLFACLAVGSAIGFVRWKGAAFGPAAVLFTALALSAWDERLALPNLVGQLGLAIFAYSIGVSSGPAFFAALRHGLGTIVAVAWALIACGGIAWGLGQALGLAEDVVAGVYAGALTNTPALAAATEQANGGTGPTVGYSVTYIGGVVIMLLAAAMVMRRSPGARRRGDDADAPLVNRTVEVTRRGLPPLGDLASVGEQPVVFSRVKRGDQLEVATEATRLEPGDLVSAIGRRDDVDAVTGRVGVPAAEHLPLDRHELDMRRMSMSRRALSGLTIAELGLGSRFGAVATRVRRGDVDFLATDDFVVHQGDRIRVIAPRTRLGEIASYLGDSERGLGDLNPVGLSLGLTLGVLVGLIPLPLPGGGTFEVGAAAGCLIIGLILGRAERTRGIVWSVPFVASITLQQLGVLIFLAVAGSRAGGALSDALASPEGIRIAIAGLAVTLSMAGMLLLVIRFVARYPGPQGGGLVAGTQTQPAVLAFVQERTSDQGVLLGYALIFPAAMIVKILVAQALVLLG